MKTQYDADRKRALQNVITCIAQVFHGDSESAENALETLVEGMYQVQDFDSEAVDKAYLTGLLVPNSPKCTALIVYVPPNPNAGIETQLPGTFPWQ